MKAAGEVIPVPIVDTLVVGFGGGDTSLAERGLL